MTEPSPSPHQHEPIPGNSIPLAVLGLCVLLAVDILVVTLIYKNGLIPTSMASATSTQTGTPPAETTTSVPVLNGVTALQATLTPSTPTPETTMNEIPLATMPSILTRTHATEAPPIPSLTPVSGPCQYTLRPGPRDFLYAIYWNWHINKNIPNLDDYYAGISCAVILSNDKCTYQAADPGTTQPGWILVLPGVSTNICLYHGGTPAP